jgi:NAD dependent epimerase/dehydratase
MKLRDARVLVTGADGFIGSHLAESLVREGARVCALAQYNSLNNWGWLEGIPCLGDLQVRTGDIRDLALCHDLMKDIDVVFHLAALIAIPYSFRAADSFVETNVKGTLNVCQAARANGVRRMVHTSTSEVYGTAQYVPIDEKHPLSPQSPYSATKMGADAIALSFFHAFGLPVVVARPFNTYGPRQSARAVIPTIITQLAAGCDEVSLGEVRATRDFTYVEDTCRAFLSLATVDAGAGEVFNIGSNDEISIDTLVSLIGDMMGVPAAVAADPTRLRPGTSEVMRLRCDGTKIERLCAFRPRIPLTEGLARTVDWFRDPANLSRYKACLYNV